MLKPKASSLDVLPPDNNNYFGPGCKDSEDLKDMDTDTHRKRDSAHSSDDIFLFY